MTSIDRARSIVGDSPGRAENDFYPTSPETTRALLGRETFGSDVWECACGRGDISEVLKSYQYHVISTDLYDYGYGIPGVDFLKTTDLLAEDIVTNPPFKLANAFLTHAMGTLRCRKLAMLLKLAFLEGSARKEIFRLYPPRWVFVFSKRVLLTRNGEKPRGSGMIAFAWYVWERDFHGYPMIDWI